MDSPARRTSFAAAAPLERLSAWAVAQIERPRNPGVLEAHSLPSMAASSHFSIVLKITTRRKNHLRKLAETRIQLFEFTPRVLPHPELKIAVSGLKCPFERGIRRVFHHSSKVWSIAIAHLPSAENLFARRRVASTEEMRRTIGFLIFEFEKHGHCASVKSTVRSPCHASLPLKPAPKAVSRCPLDDVCVESVTVRNGATSAFLPVTAAPLTPGFRSLISLFVRQLDRRNPKRLSDSRRSLFHQFALEAEPRRILLRMKFSAELREGSFHNAMEDHRVND